MDITALSQRMKQQATLANEFLYVETSNVLALVEALEKAHLEISSANRMMKAQDQELITRRQRIASLESRTVTVKLTDYRATYTEPFALEIEHHVRKALKDVADAAGIQVIEGEG